MMVNYLTSYINYQVYRRGKDDDDDEEPQFLKSQPFLLSGGLECGSFRTMYFDLPSLYTLSVSTDLIRIYNKCP